MDSNSQVSLEARLAKLEPFIQVVTSEICHDVSIRDDVMQEARIAVCRIARDHPDVGHGYYVNSIKRSILTSVQRRTWTGSERPRGAPVDPLRRTKDSLDDPEILYEKEYEDPGIDLVESHDLYDRVRQAVASLEDSRERELLYLMYWRDQSYLEMSKIIGLSKARVSAYLTSARNNLREPLSGLAVA